MSVYSSARGLSGAFLETGLLPYVPAMPPAGLGSDDSPFSGQT